MTYTAFKALVLARGWTIRQLRSDDAPPSPELAELIERVGLVKYERFVLKMQNEGEPAKCPQCGSARTCERKANHNLPDDHAGDTVCRDCRNVFWGATNADA